MKLLSRFLVLLSLFSTTVSASEEQLLRSRIIPNAAAINTDLVPQGMRDGARRAFAAAQTPVTEASPYGALAVPGHDELYQEHMGTPYPLTSATTSSVARYGNTVLKVNKRRSVDNVPLMGNIRGSRMPMGNLAIQHQDIPVWVKILEVLNKQVDANIGTSLLANAPDQAVHTVARNEMLRQRGSRYVTAPESWLIPLADVDPNTAPLTDENFAVLSKHIDGVSLARDLQLDRPPLFGQLPPGQLREEVKDAMADVIMDTGFADMHRGNYLVHGGVDNPSQRVTLIDNENILRSNGSVPLRWLVDLIFGNRARLEGLYKLGSSDGFTPKLIAEIKKESLRETLPRVSVVLTLVILQTRHVMKMQRQHWRFVGMIEKLDKIYAEKGFDAVKQSLEEVVGDKRPKVLEKWEQLVTAGYKEGGRTELRSLFSVARGQGWFKRFVLFPIIAGIAISMIVKVSKFKLTAPASLLPFLVFIPSSLKVGSKDADEETVAAVKQHTDEIMNLWTNDWSVRAKLKRMWNWITSKFKSAPKTTEVADEEVVSSDDTVVA